jgi:hypothetical protein
MVCENKFLRRIFRPRREEIAGLRKLLQEKVRKLNYSQDILTYSMVQDII